MVKNGRTVVENNKTIRSIAGVSKEFDALTPA